MYPTWSFMGEDRYNPCGYGCWWRDHASLQGKRGRLDIQRVLYVRRAGPWARAKGGWGVPAFISHFDLMPREGDYRGPLFELIHGTS